MEPRQLNISNRRSFIKKSIALGAVGTAPGVIYPNLQQKQNYKILVAGAHPDDPETGAGGIIKRFTEKGHDVSILYLTTGEAGIPGTSYDDAAAIRKAEAKKACNILGAKPIFAGQIDGASFVNNEWYDKMLEIIKDQNPDAIFTHWPVDTHRDHRHCSLLVLDAWIQSGRNAAFYYYEVMSGHQSMNFHPSHYVDITSVADKKWESCFVHESQKIKDTYKNEHAKMEDFRGRECNCQYAEAFIHLDRSPQIELPGKTKL